MSDDTLNYWLICQNGGKSFLKISLTEDTFCPEKELFQVELKQIYNDHSCNWRLKCYMRLVDPKRFNIASLEETISWILLTIVLKHIY